MSIDHSLSVTTNACAKYEADSLIAQWSALPATHAYIHTWSVIVILKANISTPFVKSVKMTGRLIDPQIVIVSFYIRRPTSSKVYTTINIFERAAWKMKVSMQLLHSFTRREQLGDVWCYIVCIISYIIYSLKNTKLMIRFICLSIDLVL